MNQAQVKSSASSYVWYQHLKKPSWAPPAFLFAPVWTLLYIGIAYSFGSVFLLVFRQEVPALVALPFGINMLANFAFTPLQFRMRSNMLAAIDILFILGTLLWAIVAIYPYNHLLAYLQLPYLAWVSFATVLQLTVTWLNRSLKPRSEMI